MKERELLDVFAETLNCGIEKAREVMNELVGLHHLT